MTAVPLIFGNLVAEHYEDDFHAAHPIIDELREKMEVVEDERYSRDYYDPERRSIANAIQVFFKDGSATDKVEVEYPIGHRRRRAEGIPVLEEKFKRNLATVFREGGARRSWHCARISRARRDAGQQVRRPVRDLKARHTWPAWRCRVPIWP